MKKYNTNKREPSLAQEVVTDSLSGVLFGITFAIIMLIVGTLGAAIGL